MSANNPDRNSHTNDAGFPPAPPEAHQTAAFEGQTKVVYLNGCKIDMRFEGGQWINYRVTPVSR